MLGIICFRILDRSVGASCEGTDLAFVERNNADKEQKPRESIKKFIPCFKSVFEASAVMDNRDNQEPTEDVTPAAESVVFDQGSTIADDDVAITAGIKKSFIMNRPGLDDTGVESFDSHARGRVAWIGDGIAYGHTSDSDVHNPTSLAKDPITLKSSHISTFQQQIQDFVDLVDTTDGPTFENTRSKPEHNKYSLASHQLTSAVEDFSMPEVLPKSIINSTALTQQDIADGQASQLRIPRDAKSNKKKRANPRRQRQAARRGQAKP
ncbi:hypothetical protein QBC34DRAFT_477520 [Podospora aff. communis PSN243]|uniref:Uncharacterized protein n=1 Tax=Podospora aff. communis PSN243 TaxID=3040156 RepID=A0AAV9G4U4_9PEZI|nr:hypothetical protein QBC34DRAFT_477520 [Podospora aff. communis PSN243]